MQDFRAEVLMESIQTRVDTIPCIEQLKKILFGVQTIFLFVNNFDHQPSKSELYLMLHTKQLVIYSGQTQNLKDFLRNGLALSSELQPLQSYILEKLTSQLSSNNSVATEDDIKELLTSIFHCFLSPKSFIKTILYWNKTGWDLEIIAKFVCASPYAENLLHSQLEKILKPHRYKLSNPAYCESNRQDIEQALEIRKALSVIQKDSHFKLTNLIISLQVDPSFDIARSYQRLQDQLTLDYSTPWFLFHIWMLRGDAFTASIFRQIRVSTPTTPYGLHLLWALLLLIGEQEASKKVLLQLFQTSPRYFQIEAFNGPINKWYVCELIFLRTGDPESATLFRKRSIANDPGWELMQHPRHQAANHRSHFSQTLLDQMREDLNVGGANEYK